MCLRGAKTRALSSDLAAKYLACVVLSLSRRRTTGGAALHGEMAERHRHGTRQYAIADAAALRSTRQSKWTWGGQDS